MNYAANATNPEIQKLYKRERDAHRVWKNLHEALEALQKVCEHDNVYDGHGHNDSYYHCTKCGLESTD